MDSFEMNKIIGALLGAVFIVFSISIVSEAIFAAPAPHTPGYAIEALEAPAGGGEEAAPQEEPIAVRMQTADAAAGQTLFARCAACHTDDSGGANKIGPNLWGVVNRPVASHEGFSYSAPMREFAQGGSVVWDYEHLDHFIAAPKSLVPGTAMSFAGLKKPEDRANLLAYLRTTADTEAPLPEAPAATAEGPAEGEQPAEGGQPAGTPPVSEGAQPVEGAQPAEGTQPGAEQPAAGEAAPAQGSTAEPAAGTTEQSAPANTQDSGETQQTNPAASAEPSVETPDGDAPTANPASEAPTEPAQGGTETPPSNQ